MSHAGEMMKKLGIIEKEKGKNIAEDLQKNKTQGQLTAFRKQRSTLITSFTELDCR
jgi:hypothetical protein